MKRFFETVFIAGCLTFIMWLIIAAGLKCEIKFNGMTYGFHVWGINDIERGKMNTISYWNNSDKVYRLVITRDMINTFPGDTEAIRYYLYSVYPQYTNGNVEKHDGFYYIYLFDGQKLNSNKYDELFTFKEDVNNLYSVVGGYALTKNLDACVDCYY